MPRVAKAEKRQDVPVVATRQFVEAEEHVTQPKPRNLKSSGPSETALDPQEIVVQDKPLTSDKAAMLAFMEEEITVLVHDTTDPTAEPLPEVINGGDRNRQYFIRGQEQKVKRKYVEVLARAKRTGYASEKFVNAVGEDQYRYPGHTALRFPFTVTHDPNPKGREWLKAILSET